MRRGQRPVHGSPYAEAAATNDPGLGRQTHKACDFLCVSLGCVFKETDENEGTGSLLGLKS